MSEKVTIRQRIQDVFPQATIADTVDGFKLHVNRLTTSHFGEFHSMTEEYGVEVDARRSGTGITLLITL